MSNKLDKRTNCLYCEKALDAKYRSKKFCDDKCRIYWNRENPKVKVTPTPDILDADENGNIEDEPLKTTEPKRQAFMSDAIKKKLGIK